MNAEDERNVTLFLGFPIIVASSLVGIPLVIKAAGLPSWLNYSGWVFAAIAVWAVVCYIIRTLKKG